VYFEYIYWKFAGRLLDRVNTPLVVLLQSVVTCHSAEYHSSVIWQVGKLALSDVRRNLHKINVDLLIFLYSFAPNYNISTICSSG